MSQMRWHHFPCLGLGIALMAAPITGLAASTDSAKRSLERVSELFKAGDVDGAIVAANKELEGNPSSAETYHLLGQMYFKGKKRPHEAAEALTHALKLKPAYPEALNDLAEVYLAQGKTAEAEQTLKRAIEVDPPAPRAPSARCRRGENRT